MQNSGINFIELNPVRAHLVTEPGGWPWSSASAHISGCDDKLVNVAPLLEMIGNKWEDFLRVAIREEDVEEMRRHERTGRPLGSESFVGSLEKYRKIDYRKVRQGIDWPTGLLQDDKKF